MQMKLAILLLCSLIVFVLADDDLERAKAKGKRECSMPKGKPGAVRYKGCTKYECVKKRRKYYWEETNVKTRCCFYNDVGYALNSTILVKYTSDDCCKAELKCENENGSPTVNLNITNNCPGPDGPPNDHSGYSAVKITNNLNDTVAATVYYAWGSRSTFRGIKAGESDSTYRGALLITEIDAKRFGEEKSCASYYSTGTGYSQFEVSNLGKYPGCVVNSCGI